MRLLIERYGKQNSNLPKSVDRLIGKVLSEKVRDDDYDQLINIISKSTGALGRE